MFAHRGVQIAKRQLSSAASRDFLGKPSWSIANQLRAGQEQPVRLSDEDVRGRLQASVELPLFMAVHVITACSSS